MKQKYLAIALKDNIVPYGLNIKTSCHEVEDVKDAWNEFKGGEEQIEICLKWLETAPRVKTKAAGEGSYALKHRVESDYRKSHVYVCNGAFMIAARIAGVKTWGPDNWRSPNEVIAISSRKWKRRPDEDAYLPAVHLG